MTPASCRSGSCGGVETAYLLNTGTGTVTIPKTPGGGPDGFWVEGLWFDRAGTAYASFISNLTDCDTSGKPATAFQAPHATPIVCKLAGGRWVKAGQDVIQSGYAPGGWLAQQSGAVTSTDGSAGGTYSLTISHGRTTITIPGVTAFAWAP